MMKKEKIGILCYSVMPHTSNWGASQRVHYMANTLAEKYDVVVLGSKSKSNPVKFDKKQDYKTIFFDNPLEKRLVGDRTTKKSSEGTVNVGIKKSIKKLMFRFIAGVCKICNGLLYNEPTYFQGIVASKWIKDNKDDILCNLKKENVQKLIISIPPWNMISMSFLKNAKTQGLKVILDYRDPWNCWNDHKGIPLSKERCILNLVDHVIVTNENHAKRLINQFGLNKSKVSVVMNGYDADAWNELEGKDGRVQKDKLNISYIGTIGFGDKNSFRDPRKFMSALSKFDHKDEVVFRVVGCRDEEALEKYRIEIPQFEMTPRVSQEESFKWMINSDVLVNFHTTSDDSSSYLIAGKAFDYYRSGSALLSINGEKSYERKFIEANNIGYYSPNEEESILKVLDDIYSDWKSIPSKFNRAKPTDDYYSRQYQNKKLFDIIKSV